MLIKQLLKYPNGIAYVAAKRYYFGVGGGTSDFIQIFNSTRLQANDSIGPNNVHYSIETVKIIEDRFSNIREILKITYLIFWFVNLIDNMIDYSCLNEVINIDFVNWICLKLLIFVCLFKMYGYHLMVSATV